jgi:hypothetical protein
MVFLLLTILKFLKLNSSGHCLQGEVQKVVGRENVQQKQILWIPKSTTKHNPKEKFIKKNTGIFDITMIFKNE